MAVCPALWETKIPSENAMRWQKSQRRSFFQSSELNEIFDVDPCKSQKKIQSNATLLLKHGNSRLSEDVFFCKHTSKGCSRALPLPILPYKSEFTNDIKK